MDSALQTDFRCAPLPCLLGSAGDFLKREIIGPTSQMVMKFTLGKCAEATGIAANIGIIDIAIDNVGHNVATHLCSQFVGCSADLVLFRTTCDEQPDNTIWFKPPSCCRVLDNPRYRRRRTCARVLSNVDFARRSHHRARYPRILTHETRGIDCRQRPRRECPVEPTL